MVSGRFARARGESDRRVLVLDAYVPTTYVPASSFSSHSITQQLRRLIRSDQIDKSAAEVIPQYSSWMNAEAFVREYNPDSSVETWVWIPGSPRAIVPLLQTLARILEQNSERCDYSSTP
jgi:hypothetical protein